MKARHATTRRARGGFRADVCRGGLPWRSQTADGDQHEDPSAGNVRAYSAAGRTPGGRLRQDQQQLDEHPRTQGDARRTGSHDLQRCSDDTHLKARNPHDSRPERVVRAPNRRERRREGRHRRQHLESRARDRSVRRDRREGPGWPCRPRMPVVRALRGPPERSVARSRPNMEEPPRERGFSLAGPVSPQLVRPSPGLLHLLRSKPRSFLCDLGPDQRGYVGVDTEEGDGAVDESELDVPTRRQPSLQVPAHAQSTRRS